MDWKGVSRSVPLPDHSLKLAHATLRASRAGNNPCQQNNGRQNPQTDRCHHSFNPIG
jgi:hypothetical protein